MTGTTPEGAVANATAAPMTRVLVYGSLKQGGTRHEMLQKIGATLQGTAVVYGMGLYVLDGFAVAIGTSELHLRKTGAMNETDVRKLFNVSITGELYELPDDALGVLDQIEGHPGLYVRTAVFCNLVNPKATKAELTSAWMYCIHALTDDAFNAIVEVPGGIFDVTTTEGQR